MNRLEQLQQIVNDRIQALPDVEIRQKAYTHSYGVSQASALLAVRRGINPEIAAVCGLLHDLYAYQAGTYENHHVGGAALAEEILTSARLFNSDEIEIVKAAIQHHDDRHLVHSPYDEVLKDADILQPYLNKLTKPSSPHAADRLSNMLKELHIDG